MVHTQRVLCPEFYVYVQEIFLELNNDSFMLVGDFNLALNSVVDTKNYNSINNPKAREKLLESIDDLNIFYYFKILNPGKKVFTWSKKKTFKTRAFRLHFDI